MDVVLIYYIRQYTIPVLQMLEARNFVSHSSLF